MVQDSRSIGPYLSPLAQNCRSIGPYLSPGSGFQEHKAIPTPSISSILAPKQQAGGNKRLCINPAPDAFPLFGTFPDRLDWRKGTSLWHDSFLFLFIHLGALEKKHLSQGTIVAKWFNLWTTLKGSSTLPCVQGKPPFCKKPDPSQVLLEKSYKFQPFHRGSTLPTRQIQPGQRC